MHKTVQQCSRFSIEDIAWRSASIQMVGSGAAGPTGTMLPISRTERRVRPTELSRSARSRALNSGVMGRGKCFAEAIYQECMPA